MLVLAGSGIYTIYYYKTVDLPDIELWEARDRISQAKKLESDIYSPTKFIMAEQLYDSATIEWKTQNERFFFLRKHDRVKDLAKQSASYASMAIQESQSISKKLGTSLADRILYLNGLIKKYNAVYVHIPQSDELQKSIFRGRLLMTEAITAYEEGKLQRSETLVMEASTLIKPSFMSLESSFGDYLDQVPKWLEWSEAAIKKSKSSGKVLLIADKYAHELYVYKGGKLLHTFPVDLGPNWIGDKRVSGDNATPEGNYLVTIKKSGRETKYHKALLINYPNPQDKKEFEAQKRAGALPGGAKIGNLIEIHGHGGRGINWTNGCIALKNTDMDVVYRLVNVNTPVVITGSLKNIEEISKGQ